MRRWRSGALLAVFAMGFALPNHAQVPIYGPGGTVWAYPPLYGVPCAPPCADPRALRRELRREQQQQEAAEAAAQLQAPPTQRTPPPPTRVEEIRPEYESASQVREEYRRSGERR